MGTQADGTRHLICLLDGLTSQVLVDFIAEWTEVQMPPVVVDQEYWMMYFNLSLMKKGAGVGLVFVLPLRVRMW